MTRETAMKRSPLKIVVIILAVIVVLVYVTACNSIYSQVQGSPFEYDARDYIYPAEHGRYAQLYDTAIHDMSKDAEYEPEVEEYRSLAFYYEQAFLEHAYRTVGDTEKADAFVERMQEYESQLGTMSNRADDVREAVAGRISALA